MTGKELKAAIYLSPLKQCQVAQLIGTTESYLSFILSGNKPVKEIWEKKILAILPNESDGAKNGEKA